MLEFTGGVCVCACVRVCTSAQYAAKLEYYDKTLGIRDAQTLLMLLLASKFMARALTNESLSERWVLVKSVVLPALDLCADLRAKIVIYIERDWLSETWGSTWTDKDRHSDDPVLAAVWRHFARTNNSQERVWITYLGPAVCNWMQVRPSHTRLPLCCIDDERFNY